MSTSTELLLIFLYFQREKNKKDLGGLFGKIKTIPLSPFCYLDFCICLPLHPVFCLDFHFSISQWSSTPRFLGKLQKVLQRGPFTQLSLIVILRITIVQQQNQEFDISTIHRPYSNVIGFLVILCVFVCLQLYAYAVLSCVDSCNYQ